MSRKQAKLGRLKTQFLINPEFGYLNSQVTDSQVIGNFSDGMNTEVRESSAAKRKALTDISERCLKVPKADVITDTKLEAAEPVTATIQLESRICALEDYNRETAQKFQRGISGIEQQLISLQEQQRYDAGVMHDKCQHLNKQVASVRAAIMQWNITTATQNDSEIGGVDSVKTENASGLDDVADGVDSNALELDYDPSQDRASQKYSDLYYTDDDDEDPYIPSLESQIERAIVAGGPGVVQGKPPCVDRRVWEQENEQ